VGTCLPVGRAFKAPNLLDLGSPPEADMDSWWEYKSIQSSKCKVKNDLNFETFIKLQTE